MKVAIVKPDHFGDLILSAAAIRAVANAVPNATLFVQAKCRPLASYLFPGLEIADIGFPHLSKGGGGSYDIPDFRSFDLVLFLRGDAIINAEWADGVALNYVLPMDTHAEHQSLIDYTVVAGLIGHYDIDAFFYGQYGDRIIQKAIKRPERIGFSIGSGFYANVWPETRWSALAHELLEFSSELRILCGPADTDKARAIKSIIGDSSKISIDVGSDDINGFVARVDELDLVIGSDGGTAHLCSLVTPVLSIFGPSPFRRYVPFGRLNRLVTRDMNCSPCCQYTSHLVNGCLSSECMSGISAEHVMSAMNTFVGSETRPRLALDDEGLSVYVGLSHLERDVKISKFWGDINDR